LDIDPPASIAGEGIVEFIDALLSFLGSVFDTRVVGIFRSIDVSVLLDLTT
jgi:hypothetical protein